MAYEIPGVMASFDAAADLSAQQFHFVALDANGDIALAADTDTDVVGVLQNNPSAAGIAGSVHLLGSGISKVRVGTGGLTVGARVSAAATGEGIAAASGDHVLGIALEAGAAGTVVPVLLAAAFSLP